MLRSGRMTIPNELVTELPNDCKFQSGVRRIAPPNVSIGISNYNGETVGADVCYPFHESPRNQRNKVGRLDGGGQFVALCQLFIYQPSRGIFYHVGIPQRLGSPAWETRKDPDRPQRSRIPKQCLAKCNRYIRLAVDDGPAQYSVAKRTI